MSGARRLDINLFLNTTEKDRQEAAARAKSKQVAAEMISDADAAEKAKLEFVKRSNAQKIQELARANKTEQELAKETATSEAKSAKDAADAKIKATRDAARARWKHPKQRSDSWPKRNRQPNRPHRPEWRTSNRWSRWVLR